MAKPARATARKGKATGGRAGVRKPVVQLTVDDMDRCPIWEYALDEEGCAGQDETWVRPVIAPTVPPDAYSQLVSADFVTRDGRALRGFMEVSTAGDSAEIRPGAILGLREYRCLESMSRAQAVARGAEYTWLVQEIDRTIEVIGGRADEIFPLTYTLRVLIRGEPTPRRGRVR